MPRWRALREIIRQFVEPAAVVRVALANLAGIDVAFVYGSFAGRHDVNPNSDIAVFVVSTPIDRSSATPHMRSGAHINDRVKS